MSSYYRVSWITEDGLKIELNNFSFIGGAIKLKNKLNKLKINCVIDTIVEFNFDKYDDFFIGGKKWKRNCTNINKT